jgi:hypothetical protein
VKVNHSRRTKNASGHESTRGTAEFFKDFGVIPCPSTYGGGIEGKTGEVSRIGFLFFLSFFFFFWYKGLNSGPSPLATPPTYFCEAFFEIGSCELFAWAGFELPSS